MYFSDDEIQCFIDRTPCSGHIDLDEVYTWENTVEALVNAGAEHRLNEWKRWNIHIDAHPGIVDIADMMAYEIKYKVPNQRKVDYQIFASQKGAEVTPDHKDTMNVIFMQLSGKITNHGVTLNPGDWQFYPAQDPHEILHDDDRISLSIGFYNK